MTEKLDRLSIDFGSNFIKQNTETEIRDGAVHLETKLDEFGDLSLYFPQKTIEKMLEKIKLARQEEE